MSVVVERSVDTKTVIRICQGTINARQLDFLNRREGGLKFLVDGTGSGVSRRFALVDVLRVRAIGLARDSLGVDLDVMLAEVRRLSAADLVQVLKIRRGRSFLELDLRLGVGDDVDLLAWCVDEINFRGSARLACSERP